MKSYLYSKKVPLLLAILSFVLVAPVFAAQIELLPPELQGEISGPADLVNRVYLYALGMVATLAVVMVVYGGIKYVASAGSASAQSDARDIIKNAIWGVLLLGGAYLILNTINPRLVDLGANEPSLDVIPTATSTTPSDTGGGSANTIRALLQANGIGAKPECSPGESVGCARLEGVQPQVINEIINLKRSCDAFGCSVFITAGTEDGHAAGQCSHSSGFKVDLRLDGALNDYIKDHFASIGTRSDGSPQWQNLSSGAVYALESDHWDVKVGC